MKPLTMNEVRAMGMGDLGLVQHGGEADQAFRERVAAAYESKTGGTTPMLVRLVRGPPGGTPYNPRITWVKIAIRVMCSRCGAAPGERCKSRNGKTALPHEARYHTGCAELQKAAT